MVFGNLRYTVSSPETLTFSSDFSPRFSQSTASPALSGRPLFPSPLGEQTTLSTSSSSSLSSSSGNVLCTATPTPATTTTTTHTKTRTKKRTRKSLAEEQELHRIMDPAYLGQPQQHSTTKGRWEAGHGYYADLEGHWHDIDYRPFGKIKHKAQLQRSWASSYSSSFYLSQSASTTSSSSLYNQEEENKDDQVPFGSRCLKSSVDGRRESLAYWETFTVVGPYSKAIHEYEDRRSGYTTSKHRASHSWSYYHHHSCDLDSDESSSSSSAQVDKVIMGGEGEPLKRHVLLKKQEREERRTGNNNRPFDLQHTFSSSSEWLSTSSSSDLEGELEEKEDVITKISQQNPKFPGSKSKTGLRRTWVTTTFIARLKVIRTKRWLRECVVLSS